ncbi:MAG: Hsp20/alpha crystallin family protein [Halothiobacillaceae bacterium]
MSAFRHLNEGFQDIWQSVAQGWRWLQQRAAGAMTRFRGGGSQDAETNLPARQNEAAARNIGWGLLAMEVFASDDELVVRLEAPGMRREDFDVRVFTNRLVIAGQKHWQRERSDGRYFVAECAYGRFERVLPLPYPVQPEAVSARYEQGVLTLHLPRPHDTAAARRRVEVR